MISHGDKFIKNKTVNGVILIVSVESKEPEDEYLIEVRNIKTGEKFFRHIEILKTKWTDMKKGIQTKMFK